MEKITSEKEIKNKRINIPEQYKDCAESFRTLRTNIMYSSNIKTIVVTSTVPDEGKTIITFNVGLAFAQAGKKVLLIDADMRRKSLSELLRYSKKEEGLSEYLTNQGVALIYPTSQENLYILPSGATPPNSTELLTSDLFANLIKYARDEFDYIIIDSAPFSVCNDAITIAQNADGTIVTVRYRFIHKRFISKLIETYNRNNAKIIGFVLNRVKRQQVGNYYGKYGKYYSKYYSGYKNE